MTTRSSRWWAAVWGAIWLSIGPWSALPAWPQPAAAPLPVGTVIEYDPTTRMLTVHASGVPLPHLLDAVTKETGVAFQLPADQKLGNRPVALTFDKMPLERAIKQLLRQTNYAMIYGAVAEQPGGLTQVQVFPLSEGSPAPVFSSVATPPSQPAFVQQLSPDERQKRQEERQAKIDEKKQQRLDERANRKKSIKPGSNQKTVITPSAPDNSNGAGGEDKNLAPPAR